MTTSLAVVGMGYVGIATALAFTSQNRKVVCVDVDSAKVEAVKRGKSPFREPGVEEAIRSAIDEGRLTATVDGSRVIAQASFSFLCVGTPAREDGSMDDRQLRAASRMVGEALRRNENFHVVVVKSTVLPGTTETVVQPEIERASGGNARVGLCMNPEFLKEGSALQDALHPDRIVIGERDKASGDALEDLYRALDCPRVRCDLRTAEMIKYATNAFLATKVSFANELANLCEAFDVDSDLVIGAMGMDPRINPRFMVPGVGFGGSCLPKDVAALVTAARARGYEGALLRAVIAVNNRQPKRAIEHLQSELGDLGGKRIAILGLAFKAGTDDVRESRALLLAEELMRLGATVVGYDPAAGANFAKAMPKISIAASYRDALAKADGCVIQADWPEFQSLTADDFSEMKTRIVVDGRRTLGRESLRGRVVYRRIG